MPRPTKKAKTKTAKLKAAGQANAAVAEAAPMATAVAEAPPEELQPPTAPVEPPVSYTHLDVYKRQVCRSPMAEGIFRQAVQGRGDYRVASAGLGAAEGAPPSAYAVQAVKELGIDISGLRSQMLTADLVDQADYIFGMTHSHIDTVKVLYPQAEEKTFLLREFDETLDAFEKDISLSLIHIFK